MNTREVTNHYRLSHWNQILSERCDGEKIDEFCARKDISKAQFFYWKRKLREAACTELIQKEMPKNIAVPNGWSVCKPAENPSALSIEVGDYRISVSNNFNPELLSQVCKVLGSI